MSLARLYEKNARSPGGHSLVVILAFLFAFAGPEDVSAQGDPAETSRTQDASTSGGADDSVTATEAASTASGITPGFADLDDGAKTEDRIQGLETNVNELREKVFETKARILLLREAILQGIVSGARAIVYHVNDLGASYSLESATYFLDGSKIFSQAGDLDNRGELKIFEANIPPGNHQISVNLVILGDGHGVFAYLDDYRFTVSHAYNFIAEEGKVSRLRVISYERGWFYSFVDRPSLKYDLVTDRNVPAASEERADQ